MKNILIFTLSLLTTTLSAQFVNGKPIAEIDSKYIRLFQLVGKNGSVSVHIDYGQIANHKETRISDEDGDRYFFNSNAHVFNVFHDYGYEIKEILIVGEYQSENSAIYLLERLID